MSKYYIEIDIESSSHITYGNTPNKSYQKIKSFILKKGQVEFQNYQCNFVTTEISDSGFYEHVYSSNVNLIYPLGIYNGEQIDLTEAQAFYQVYQIVNENEKTFLTHKNKVMFSNCFVTYIERKSEQIIFTIKNKANDVQESMFAIVKKTEGLNGIYRLLKPTKQTYQIQKFYDLNLLKSYYDNGGIYFDNLTFDYSKTSDEHIDLNTKQKVECCYNTSSRGYRLEFLQNKFYHTLQEAEVDLKTIGEIEPPVCLAENSYYGLILPVNSKPFFIRTAQWFLIEYVDIVNNQLETSEQVQFLRNEEIPELYINKYYISEGQKYLYPGYKHVSVTIKDVCPVSEGINEETYAWYYFIPPRIDVTNAFETFVIPVEEDVTKNLYQYFSINYSYLTMNFQVLSGELPTGMSMSSSGVLTGNVSISDIGEYTFVVKATSFRCENQIEFRAVKAQNNEIIGIVQDKTFVFYKNISGRFDLTEGLSQNPLNQPWIFTVPEGFPTNISLSQDGILSGTITGDNGFEFDNSSMESSQESSEGEIEEQRTTQTIIVKTQSSVPYDMRVNLVYSAYRIVIENNYYSFRCKYGESTTFHIPISYNIMPELEVENPISGLLVAIESNQIQIVSSASTLFDNQQFTIVLNKGKISETSIVVSYTCYENIINISQNVFEISGYWFMPITSLDLKNFVSNEDNEAMTFVPQSSLPSGISISDGVISGSFGENTSDSSVDIQVSCANSVSRIVIVNFSINEYYFNIEQRMFNINGIRNQLNTIEISNVVYNKVPSITKTVSSSYEIEYFIENGKLKCSFNISDQTSFSEVISINGIEITINYTIGDVIILNVQEHLNNFVYYEYPLTSGATSVTNIEYSGFRECNVANPTAGYVNGKYPWRDISIKNNKLIFKVYRSDVSYNAQLKCTLNTGEKFILNVEVNDTAPFVELGYIMNYNGGCYMSMSHTNYHYHHRCSPISSTVIGEVIYTVLSRTDDDLVAAVDENGALTMTTFENNRKTYTGWVVFRVYNNGGHGDYLLYCERRGKGGNDGTQPGF